MNQKKIYVFIAEGFEEIEAITPIDIFKRAGFDVVLVSITDRIEVKGAHDITIKTNKLLKDIHCADADLLFLPGGMPGSNNLNASVELKDILIQANETGIYISAICAAPLVLGGLGILKNKKATCYPGYEHTLLGADVQNNSCVVSNNIITGKGAGAAAEFAFTIVELLQNKETSNKLKSAMQF